MTYVLHYAPDNASLIIRLALEHRGLAYRTQLVDRKADAQRSAGYLALNPNGLIPVLETPQGPLFETGAILLWLADKHGGLGPAPDAVTRGDFLKWLFFASNTLHSAERMLFYPDKYIAANAAQTLRTGLRTQLARSFATLETVADTRPAWLGAKDPTVLDFYVAALLRWPMLYPADEARGWLSLSTFPALGRLCAHLETLPCTLALQKAEGLGKTPFTDPQYPTPPEGSAT
ncbi:MAG: glutathione S-transferase family protein [Sulfitobacter sp.]